MKRVQRAPWGLRDGLKPDRIVDRTDPPRHLASVRDATAASTWPMDMLCTNARIMALYDEPCSSAREGSSRS